MNNLTPDEQEQVNAKVVYDKAQMLAYYFTDPPDVTAATAAILHAAYLLATSDLSPERRAALFLEDK